MAPVKALHSSFCSTNRFSGTFFRVDRGLLHVQVEWFGWSGKFIVDLLWMEQIEHRLSLDTIVAP